MGVWGTMREKIPGGPREGSLHGVSISGIVAGSVVMNQPQEFQFLLEIRTAPNLTALLVLPVRILRMLDVPKRPPALHFRSDRKVVRRRWGRCRPFQRPRIPRIVAGRTSAKV